MSLPAVVDFRRGVDHDANDLLQLLEVGIDGQRPPRATDRADGLEWPAQGEVVRQTTIQQMHIRMTHGVPIHSQLPQLPRAARPDIAGHQRHPRRFGMVTTPGIIIECDRTEDDRKRRRSCHRARHRKRGEVGTQEIKLVLDKLKGGVQRNVRGVERQKGTAISLHQIFESLSPKQMPVVKLGGHVAAVVVRRGQPVPVGRQTEPPKEIQLKIAVEEFALKVGEDRVAVECVIGRRKTAAGHRRDVIHLIQQSPSFPFPNDLRVGQRFQHAVRQRRGARPAAGKRQEHLQAVRVAGVREIPKPVAATRVAVRQPRIRRVVSATSGKQKHCDQRESFHFFFSATGIPPPSALYTATNAVAVRV